MDTRGVFEAYNTIVRFFGTCSIKAIKINTNTKTGNRPEGSNHVNRGGRWNNNANNCKVANRNNNSPGNSNNNIGFRLVLP
ncbi:MAG: SUMF1/EgtB/PvdO family nonheme iron enzyme [Bacteroidales bacterium]|nr:SUMF1/EgtB/PvdO family nonheme iron enzyme [Bacteroidales bacterium]